MAEESKPRKKSLAVLTESLILGTGFSHVANELLPRMVKDGYEVSVWATQYMGLQMNVNGVWLYPVRKDTDIGDLQDILKPDIIMPLGSWHFLKIFAQHGFKGRWKGKALGYIVLDVPPLEDWEEDLKVLDKLITPSQYSKSLFKKYFNTDAEVIPHGVNLDIFKPKPKPDMGVDGVRFICMATNVIRKMVPRAMRAFQKAQREAKKRNLKMRMMLFSNPNQQGGFRLLPMRKMMGLQDTLDFPGRIISSVGVPWGQMANMYNLAHMHVNPSSGESFGLPFLEAAACGLPTITTDFGAAREILGDSAIYIPVKDWFDTDYGELALVDVDLMAHAMYTKALEYRLSPEAYKHDSEEALERARLFPWEKGYSMFKRVIDDL